jgi:hypothetical protein
VTHVWVTPSGPTRRSATSKAWQSECDLGRGGAEAERPSGWEPDAGLDSLNQCVRRLCRDADWPPGGHCSGEDERLKGAS